jgi:hypothetical protein
MDQLEILGANRKESHLIESAPGKQRGKRRKVKGDWLKKKKTPV